VAGGATAIYAYYQSVQEDDNLRTLAEAANRGWDDFYFGFLPAVGIDNDHKKDGPLWDEGQRHGKAIFDWRVKSAARKLNDSHPDLKLKFSDNDPEVRAYLASIARANKEQWYHAVDAAYEKAVRTKFYYYWRSNVSARQAEHDDLYARARAGLSHLEPDDKPDYTWFSV